MYSNYYFQTLTNARFRQPSAHSRRSLIISPIPSLDLLIVNVGAGLNRPVAFADVNLPQTIRRKYESMEVVLSL